MSDDNKILRYNNLAIAFHWITALLFLILYFTVYYRRAFTVRGEWSNGILIRVHFFAGVLVLLIVILRIIWSRISPPPQFPKQPPLENFAKKTVQYILVFFMFFMPITGYLGTGTSFAPLSWIGIPEFYVTDTYIWLVEDGLGLEWVEFEKPVDFLHKMSGRFLVWFFILGHSGAALYHYFIRKDDMLQRMVPFLKRRK